MPLENTAFQGDNLDVFLASIAHNGLTYSACKLIGVSMTHFEKIRKQYPEFEEQYQEALEAYRDKLRKELLRRGHDGWEEPVYQNGILVGHKKKFDSKLLELELKRRCPEYREKIDIDANVTGGVLVVGATPKDAQEWEKEFNEEDDGETE
jgi:hypothetical protein